MFATSASLRASNGRLSATPHPTNRNCDETPSVNPKGVGAQQKMSCRWFSLTIFAAFRPACCRESHAAERAQSAELGRQKCGTQLGAYIGFQRSTSKVELSGFDGILVAQ